MPTRVQASRARRVSDGRVFADAAFEAAEAAARSAAGWIERDLLVAGIALRLRFAGPALLDVLVPPLAHLLSVPGEAREPAVTVDVWDTASTGVRLPPAPWARETLDVRGHVRELADDGIAAYENVHFGGLTLFDAARAHGLYWAAAAERIPWYERGSPLRTMLHLALSGPQRHLLHAGAVGETLGILIGGRSGSGKSTVALACVQAGFGYAGDDYVLVSPEPEPVAHCLYTTAKLDPDGLRREPALAEHVVPAASIAEKAVLDLGRGRPAQIRTSLPLGALVFPRVRAGGTSELRPLPAVEALRALAPSTLIQMPHRGGDVLRCMSALVRELPSYRLELGRDLPRAIELLRPLTEAA